MDIKSKKGRPFLVWLSFFLGINIIISMFILGSFTLSDGYSRDDLAAALRLDIKDMYEFKRKVCNWFDYLAWNITVENAEDLLNERINELIETGDVYYTVFEYDRYDRWVLLRREIEYEGENLAYYAKNTKTGRVLTNLSGIQNGNGAENGNETGNGNGAGILELLQDPAGEGLLVLPEGYDYCLFFDGTRFILQKDGRLIDIYMRNNDEYIYKTYLARYMSRDWKNNPEETPDISGCIICLLVRSEIKANPYVNNTFYSLLEHAEAVRTAFFIAVFIFFIGAGLLILSAIKKNQKREFDRKLALVSGKLWFEVKGILTFIVIIFVAALHFNSRNSWPVILLVVFWWSYIMLADLLVNRGKFFSNNSITWLIGKYRAFERKKPFQKAMLLRIYTLISGFGILAFFVFMFTCIALAERTEGFFFLSFFFSTIIAAYLVYRYIRRYKAMIDDMGRLCDHIKAIREGNTETKLELDKDADLYPVSRDLNTIQQGISVALEQQLKSERMKVDLITNVSHDLKTPLTSIISYVDLLSKEEDLPAHVKDYVGILAHKSQQLKSLINDLFDLSKATSKNIEVKNEKLSLSKLMQQVLGEFDEEIQASGLDFRVSIPQEPVYIISDGAKLHRVFGNIIINALKYSLVGTRVYVQLVVEGNKAVAEVKNIANYEMDFDEETILQRFTRGDKARTTEGSGLGLAIARHFTDLCGGEFRIKIDGDLFKVELSFNACT